MLQYMRHALIRHQVGFTGIQSHSYLILDTVGKFNALHRTAREAAQRDDINTTVQRLIQVIIATIIHYITELRKQTLSLDFQTDTILGDTLIALRIWLSRPLRLSANGPSSRYNEYVMMVTSLQIQPIPDPSGLEGCN